MIFPFFSFSRPFYAGVQVTILFCFVLVTAAMLVETSGSAFLGFFICKNRQQLRNPYLCCRSFRRCQRNPTLLKSPAQGGMILREVGSLRKVPEASGAPPST